VSARPEQLLWGVHCALPSDGRDMGALDVDRDAADQAVTVEVDHEGLRRVGAVDALGQLGYGNPSGVDDAVALHGVAAELRHEVGDERHVLLLAAVDVAEGPDALDVVDDARRHRVPVVGDHAVEEVLDHAPTALVAFADAYVRILPRGYSRRSSGD